MSDLAQSTVTIAELAAALGRSPVWLRRNWKRLHEKEGLPRMIPGGLTFPRGLVTAWLSAGGFVPVPRQADNENDGGDVADPVEAAHAFLRSRRGLPT